MRLDKIENKPASFYLTVIQIIPNPALIKKQINFTQYYKNTVTEKLYIDIETPAVSGRDVMMSASPFPVRVDGSDIT